MSSIPLELYRALQDAGIPDNQAQAAAKSVWDANQLASKSDVHRLENKIDRIEGEIKGELKLVKWMLMLAIVIIVTVVPVLQQALN